MTVTSDLTEAAIVQIAQRAAIEAVQAIQARNPGMTAGAGTVTDIGENPTPGAVDDPVANEAMVIPDGSELAVPADSVTAHPVRPGDRVYMLKVPPHGFVIIGRIRVAAEVEEAAPIEGVIVQDTPGTLTFYDSTGKIVGRQSTIEWAMGDIDPVGHRVTIDPVGGLRFRSETDVLMHGIDQNGLTLRDEQTGLIVAQLTGGDAGSFRLVDPVGVDDIEMVTSSVGTLPNPKLGGPTPEANPSSSIVAPVAALFTTSPADDISLYHAAAWLAGTSQSGTWTPPAGTTERMDIAHNGGSDTLSASIATRDPATGVAATFTSSQTNWTQGMGTHVVIRGGGTTSPSYRSISEASYAPTDANSVTATLAKPSGVVQGDAMVAFVSMGNAGGSIPTGWREPEGWVFLGANFLLNGAGPTQNCLAVGAWAKLAGASEPTDYEITVTFGAGTKRLHAAVVAIQNPYLVAGGAHIRMAGHPIRRLLQSVELTAAAGTLCDFQNIPAGYDHLELVFTGASDRNTDALREVALRVNNDSGNNYNMQSGRDGVYTQLIGTTRIVAGAIDGATTAMRSSGRINIFEYARAQARMVLGDGYFTQTGALTEQTIRGDWNNLTDAINRVTLFVNGGTVLFAIGSRAYLYGY